MDKALSSKTYVREKWELLRAHGLTCQAVSSHLVGQAVCDLIDERHRAILPPDVWGDGKPEGVRRRAAKNMVATAKAARRFFDARPVPSADGLSGRRQRLHRIVDLALDLRLSPTAQEYWERGFDDFATRWAPILDAFDAVNVNFGLEVHPTEIAFDIARHSGRSTRSKGHRRFGFNYDPSHLGYQGVDYVKFIRPSGAGSSTST